MSTLRYAAMLLAMCLMAGVASADDRDAVNAVLDNIQKAHESHNIGLLGDQYSEGLLVVGESPNLDRGAFVMNKDKILAATRDQVWQSAGLQARRLTGRKLAVRDDLAFVRTTVVDRFKDGKSDSSEQFLICVRKDSRWTVCFAMPALAKGEITVKAVLPGSAADKAQIKAGDVIAARNGEDIDPVLLGNDADGIFGPKGGADVSLALRRSSADVHLQVPSGLQGATVEMTLVPSGAAQFVPLGQPHPVRDIVKKEIEILKTGDLSAYQAVLAASGFFSYRRETGGATTLVTGQNALKMIGKQLEDSQKALKASTIELQSTGVIATPNIALAAGTLRAVDRGGAPIQILTRLHVYARDGKAWFLVADLMDRFHLASDSSGAILLSADETRKSDSAIKGKMVGIGAKLSGGPEGIVIEGVIPGAPAERAGLRSGEIIVSVDGHPMKDKPVTEVVQTITGEEGTSVTLEILGASGGRRTVKITRETIKLSGVEAKLLDSRIGYVGITAFNLETAPAVREALTKTLSPQNAAGIVLDLRGNSGGLLPAVVSVAELFIDGNPPKVLWVARQKGKEPVFVQARSSAVTALPCVALIDEKTNGGAELLAEALRQQSRATLVGTKTAGGAVMRERVANPDGSSRVVEIGDFLFPSTGKTGADGVIPDVIAPKDATPAQLLELGKSALKKLIK